MQIVQLVMTLVHADFLLLRASSGLFARSKEGETTPKNAQGRFLTNVGILTCSRAIRLVTHVQDNTNLYMQIVQLVMTLVHADFLLLRASSCVRHVALWSLLPVTS
jgi:hypothetical protein